MAFPHDPREATYAGRKTDGSPVRRPMSPHLQVYDMTQLPSMTSITHRATGVAWCAGLLLLVWWLVAAASGPAAFDKVQWFLGSFLGVLILLGMTAVAWYHTLNGVRHLVWDFGAGFSLPEAYASGRAVVIGTAALTLLTWVVGLIVFF